MAREDLYQKVTDTIVAELERGVAPWIQPWRKNSAGGNGGPYNGYTGSGYRGVNVVLLLVAAVSKSYRDLRWFTFLQAKHLGVKVKRGEKSTGVIFWKRLTLQEKNEGSDDVTEKQIPLLRSYAVFNAEQCEGIPELPKVEESPQEFRYGQAQALFDTHKVDVRHGGDRAFFVPSLDFIQMPNLESFENEEHYWGTKLHEAVHWSGHTTRLNRELGKRFGSAAYAAEELVAEMGAAFLCAQLGIQGRLRHSEYIANWLKVLKDDKRAVFKAASLAQAAVDFVLDFEVEGPEPLDVDLSA